MTSMVNSGVETINPDGHDGAVVLDGVEMTFRNGADATTAVADVSGTVRAGSFVSIVGPSGCGKSTLLDLVAGLQSPTSGAVMVDGGAVRKPRRDTALVFQEDSTLHWRTVLDNVAFGLEMRGVGKRERRAVAQEMVELVGLGGFEKHRPRQLSGGMRQRVAIARALAMNPSILLMDEPFGALDQQTRHHVGAELTRIWESTRKTVLFVTHDVAEAVYLSDQVWVMSKRPSRLSACIDITLPRPRSLEVMSTDAFQHTVAQIWEMLA